MSRLEIGLKRVKSSVGAFVNKDIERTAFYSRSCTAFHKVVESSFDRDIIPFAVPLRRKSASFTALIKASCNTFPSASGRTSICSGQFVKCTVRRHGRWFDLSMPSLDASENRLLDWYGGDPEKRS